jgi:membrane fusion protein, heavy metal efflux system
VSHRLLSSCLVSLVLMACGGSPSSSDHGHGHGHGHGPTAAGIERGPHRGRMLRSGDFALELQIFEDGVPPEFHVYLYRDGKPLSPESATVTVELTRLGNKIDRFEFAPHGDYLLGKGLVYEPHSFSVAVRAAEGGREHQWTFDSFEGRTTIPAKTAEAAGIGLESAGPAVIAENVTLTGRIVPNAEKVRAVSARFPGPIQSVARSIGDPVRKGDTLATVESNESLQTYAVVSPIDGIVVERHANTGETAGSDPLFVVADYRQLWAELALFPRDLPRVRSGQPVQLRSVDGDLMGSGRIVRIAPAEGPSHGSLSGIYTARVALENAESRWVPGLFVEGKVRIGEARVPLAVKRTGLQAFRDFTVVFERIEETYEVRMLELGRQDETWVEVLGGIEPGARYVAENSYLIKADIEKSGASHDH